MRLLLLDAFDFWQRLFLAWVPGRGRYFICLAHQFLDVRLASVLVQRVGFGEVFLKREALCDVLEQRVWARCIGAIL